MPAQITRVDNSAAILAALEAAVGGAVHTTSDEMAQALRDEMTASKSGRDYGGHIASAAGEAPANWHDVLMGTIVSEATGPTSAAYSAGGEAAPYLEQFLEWGSPGGTHAPRPMMVPSIDIAGPLLVQNVTEAVKEVLR